MAQTVVKRKLPRRKMVRKQVYLLPQQEVKLKELAQQQLTTEAELIRKAVEAFLSQPTTNIDKQLPPDEAAWQLILASFEEVKQRNVSGEPHRWTRGDYYDDPRYQRNWSS
ncbi:MAG: hypothetical protein U0350_37245 [Caldilineaceae bacterium]